MKRLDRFHSNHSRLLSTTLSYLSAWKHHTAEMNANTFYLTDKLLELINFLARKNVIYHIGHIFDLRAPFFLFKTPF